MKQMKKKQNRIKYMHRGMAACGEEEEGDLQNQKHERSSNKPK